MWLKKGFYARRISPLHFAKVTCGKFDPISQLRQLLKFISSKPYILAPVLRYEFDKATADHISSCRSRDYGDDVSLQNCLNASNLISAIDNGEMFCK